MKLNGPQQEAVEHVDGPLLIFAGAGCHRIGQPILMYDGSVKAVEDVVVGDLLMGPDSQPREVLSLCRGEGQMYEVVPVKGRSFVVNEDHVLTLVKSGARGQFADGDLVDVDVKSYLRWSSGWIKGFKLARVGVEFTASSTLPVDPYFVGLVLGDGSATGVAVSKPDPEIFDELCAQARKWGLSIRKDGEGTSALYALTAGKRGSLGLGRHRNRLLVELRSLGVAGMACHEKRVPFRYKASSERDRKEVLAGLLDSDGSLSNGGYDFISKSRQLSLDVAFIARSLGLAAYVSECEKSCQTGATGTYHRVSISGETSKIPCRIPRKKAPPRRQIKSVLRTGFSLRKLGIEPYYGFTLTGDGRYLLDDFTVTHNSGKTRVVTHRIANLIQKHDVPPSRIIAVTFTNKAAREMRDRIEGMLGKVEGLTIGTFHSICVRILRRYFAETGRRKDFIIYDENDQEAILKAILKDEEALATETNVTWPQNMKVAIVAEQIERNKRELRTPNDVGEQEEGDRIFRRIWERYERQLLAANAYDFADLIVYGMHLAERKDAIGDELRGRWKHVMVDEFQDTDEPQFRLVRALAANGNLCVVGDDDQCHPPGVLVQMTRAGETKAIEDLADDEIVVGWDRSALRDGRRIRVGSRRYNGPLHTITVGDKQVPMTSNHRLVCRWADRRSDACVVYLMWREGFGFRVGWCQLFNAEGALHLGQRARLEKADKVWVLGAFDSRTGASVYESIVSPRYGLPTITFEPAYGAQHMTAESIREVFDALAEAPEDEGMMSLDNEDRGMRCLADHDMHFDLPFYPLPGKSWESMGRTTLFEVYAANLMPGLMMVPVVQKHGNTDWKIIDDVDNDWYEGEVHSLAVERDETYVANGVVVHNCIYTWRGAKPEYIRKFRDYFPNVKVVKLEENYRSTKRIVEGAAAIIEKNVDSREPKRMRTANHEGEHIWDVTCEDERDEAELVAETSESLIKSGTSPSQIAVLYRSHVQSRAIEEALRSLDIRYKIHGGFRFFDRSEIRDAMAYMRLLVNPHSNIDLIRSINMPPRGVGAKTIGRIADAAASRKCSMFEALEDAEKWPGLGVREKQGIVSFRALINGGREGSTEERPSEVVATLMEKSGLIKYWLNEAARHGDEGKQKKAEEDLARSQNLQELLTDAATFERRAYENGEVAAFDDYVERITMLSEETDDADEKSVHLMTLHGSKGLEFENVFLVGCERGLFPRAAKGTPEEHEERRLMYVGTTRAKKRLFICHAEQRFIYGKTVSNEPSYFIDDIPSDMRVAVSAESVKRSNMIRRSA